MQTNFTIAGLLSLIALLMFPSAQEAKGPFSSTTIDFGIVVSDLEAAVEFYGKGLGFREVEGFQVDAEFCRDAGLTNSKPLDVRVFVLGEGPKATKVKLMEVADTMPKTSDNAFIHSQLGFSYLTVYVSDMAGSLERLKNVGVSCLAKTPLALGSGEHAPKLSLVCDPDGNLIELIGPNR